MLKKKKIKQYLEQKSEYSIFDNLLRLYISDGLPPIFVPSTELVEEAS